MNSTDKQSITCVNSIYQQPWWLDAVAPGQWGEVTVTEGGHTVARMPYFTKRKFGLIALTMPPLTQTLGPWLKQSEGKYAKRLAAEQAWMEELIAKLPGFDLFSQSFSFEITDWLPFYWAGFRQTTLYTYRFDTLTDLGAIWDGVLHSVRQNIRKAEKIVTIRTDLGIDRLLQLTNQVFARQNMENPYDPDTVRRLDTACARNNCGRAFFAEDAEGRIHAALYIAWDDRCAHCILSGADPSLRNSHAGSLLTWAAVQFAATVTKSFDFTGSVMKSLERHKRSFGGRQVPYFAVRKMNLRMTALNAARDIGNVIRRR